MKREYSLDWIEVKSRGESVQLHLLKLKCQLKQRKDYFADK